ncbi:MAG: Cna B-type domain-containing protein, partial [Oscillospiraceae bacterium]|nr:Cna B-type domain-containing protein [Oscillospiraceae bacterium]
STELPSDPSTVKAIVVDASKDANGNAVVSEASEEEDSYVPIYIHMRAPLGEEPFANSEDRMDAEKNAHAFNKAFTYCESAGEGKEGAVYGWYFTSSTMVGILPYSVSVTKAWNDHDDNDGIRPESITVSLYGNGELVDTKTVTEDENGNWYVEFPHVRRFDDKSVPITYTVVETNIDGYEASVELTSSTEAMQSFKITNSHDDELTSIPFTKIWDIPDGEDDGEDRPTALVMHLYRWVETTTVDAETGEETTTGEWVDTGAMKYLRAGDNDAVWSGSFDNLKKYENHGKEIIYTVREEAIERYITSYEEYTPGDADEDNKNAPEITNRYYPYSDIVITKTVVNATAKALEGENGVFTFNLALTYKGEAVVQYFDYEKTLADGTVETGKILGVSEFTLRDGESLKILKVRADTEYEITENDKAGYTLISSSGTTGTIKAGVTAEAKFTNHYESSGYATLEARKELTGRALAGYQFRFEIKNADGEVIGTAYNSASSDSTVEGGTATVYLPNLNYTEADDGAVYYYTVSETVPDPLPGGYTYDNTVYTVKVSVADNGNGTLTIEVEYVDLPEGETEPVFKNEYHAEGALGLKAWKALKGGSLADYEDVFEFEIVDENGERVGETATNDAEGVILFDEIEYTEKDVGKTYLYVIREINTEDERVIYDEDVFGYLVTVYDNGNGTLNFQQKIVAVKLEEGKYAADEEAEMPEPVFRNKLTSGSLTITKNISWADSIQDEDTIAALREKEFTFKIRFYGEEVPEDVTVEKTNAAGGGSAPTGGIVSAMAGSVAVDPGTLETAAARPREQAGTNTQTSGGITVTWNPNGYKMTISGNGTIDVPTLKTMMGNEYDISNDYYCQNIVFSGNIKLTGSAKDL